MIYLLADDLTGALDSAVQFAAVGLKAVVRLKPVGRDEIAPDVDLNGFDLDTRRLTPGQAAERTAGAVRTIGPDGDDRIYHKIDSTVRSHLGPVIPALLDSADRSCALVAPALPSQGRTTVGGKMYLHGQALEKALAEVEPGRPIPDGDLVGRFRRECGLPVSTIGRETIAGGPEAAAEAVKEHSAEGRFILVGDAGTDADLDTLVAGVGRVGAGCILVGSAGLAAALARSLRPIAAGRMNFPGCKRILLVSGSGSTVAARQWRRLIDSGEAPCFDLTLEAGLSGEDWRGGLESAGAVGLRLDPAVLKDGRRDRLERLVAMAARGIAGLKPDALVLVGGDTSRSLAEASGIEEFEPITEITPGCPLSRVGGGVFDGRLTVNKAGAFGGPETLVEVVKSLRKGTA